MNGDVLRTAALARAAADLLIDRDRLSQVVGRAVRATRLRHKSGLSTRAVLLDDAGNRPPSWVQVVHRAHVDKLTNAQRRAGQRGQHIELRDVPSRLGAGDLLLAFGEIDSDPRLQRGLDIVRETFPSVHQAVARGQLSVLRYNPQRRLVLRCEPQPGQVSVTRVTAEKQNQVYRRLAALADAGVPVLQPTGRDARRSRRVSVWPWFGTTDLQQVPTEDATPYAEEAGRALGVLHTVATHNLRLGAVAEPATELAALTQDLAQIEPDAARRMRTLVEQVVRLISARDWETGTVHGDFSADQVLIDHDEATLASGLLLSDFDRIGTGAPEMDVGTFAAAELLDRFPDSSAGFGRLHELPLTGALVAGYRRQRPMAAPEPDPVWVARALLARVFEPFRNAEPDWQHLLHIRLDQVDEVLS